MLLLQELLLLLQDSLHLLKLPHLLEMLQVLLLQLLCLLLILLLLHFCLLLLTSELLTKIVNDDVFPDEVISHGVRLLLDLGALAQGKNQHFSLTQELLLHL